VEAEDAKSALAVAEKKDEGEDDGAASGGDADAVRAMDISASSR